MILVTFKLNVLDVEEKLNVVLLQKRLALHFFINIWLIITQQSIQKLKKVPKEKINIAGIPRMTSVTIFQPDHFVLLTIYYSNLTFCSP